MNTYHDYLIARDLERQDLSFYALVQAAMRRASTSNLEKLQTVFPEVWHNLQARYQAPGGLLPDEWEAGMRPHDGYVWPVAQAAAQDLVIGDDLPAVVQDLVIDDDLLAAQQTLLEQLRKERDAARNALRLRELEATGHFDMYGEPYD